jgi:uncharacterized protein (TIGR00725 family)
VPPSPVCVAVVGPGDEATPDECARARDIGRLLAERGIVVLTGGLGGVMAAAADGATSAGGLAVGVLPGSDRTGGHPHSSVLLATGLGELRNAVLVRSADAVIAVGGSWGTLSEAALAMRCGIAVVSVDGWAVGDSAGEPVHMPTASSAAEAVGWVLDQMSRAQDAGSAAGTPPGKMDR